MKKSILAIVLALVLSLGCFAGCSRPDAVAEVGTPLATGGVLVLSVNPEIAVEYDENGLVTGVSARNDDAIEIISTCKGLIGQEARTVITTLVTAIGDAGYFVEEIEGNRRQITIEIEAGSALPHDKFLDDVVSDVRDCVNNNNWNVPTEVENESDYGLSDYIDTDYGPNNDGVTDFSDYGTDYDDTDYGPNNDGVTDYTDYEAASPYTDYSDSPYEEESPYTDYSDSPYEEESPYTDYSDSPYEADSPYSDYEAESAYSDYDDSDYD